jgi:hypothetical protein
MNDTPTPKPVRRRRVGATKQMNIRMDVELWARLEETAPLVRRSVGNLLMWLVATGLDRLDDERDVQEVLKHSARLLAGMTPRQIQGVIARQRELLRQVPIVTATAGVKPTRRRRPPARRRRS